MRQTYFEHFDQAETSHRTGQSNILQYWRWAGGGWGHIVSGTTIVFSPPRVTSWMHWTWKLNFPFIFKNFNRRETKFQMILNGKKYYEPLVHEFQCHTILSMVKNRYNSIAADTVDHYMFVFLLLVLFRANIKMVKQLYQYLLVHNLWWALQRHPNKMHYSLYSLVLSIHTFYPAPKQQLLSNLCDKLNTKMTSIHFGDWNGE